MRVPWPRRVRICGIIDRKTVCAGEARQEGRTGVLYLRDLRSRGRKNQELGGNRWMHQGLRSWPEIVRNLIGFSPRIPLHQETLLLEMLQRLPQRCRPLLQPRSRRRSFSSKIMWGTRRKCAERNGGDSELGFGCSRTSPSRGIGRGAGTLLITTNLDRNKEVRDQTLHYNEFVWRERNYKANTNQINITRRLSKTSYFRILFSSKHAWLLNSIIKRSKHNHC